MHARPLSMAIIGFFVTTSITLAGASAATNKLRPQVGIASYYSMRFHGRTMADGGVFLAGSNSAASRTLPLGTVAQVTNKANHRSAIVVIRDRGPYAARRIIDLSPATAGRLGFRNEGVASVTVSPLRVMHTFRHTSKLGRQYSSR